MSHGLKALLGFVTPENQINRAAAAAASNYSEPPPEGCVDGREMEECDVAGPEIPFTDEEMSHWSNPWKHTLIVQILAEQNLTFEALQHKLQRSWTKNGGTITVTDMENGFFSVKFTAEEDYNHALYEGPWLVADSYLLLQRWRPLLSLTAEQRVAVVWIRILKLPIELCNPPFLSRIGSTLGVMLKVDDRLSGKYARICVEIDLDRRLVSNVMIRGHRVNLQYEGLDGICFRCGRYGNKKGNCVERVDDVYEKMQGKKEEFVEDFVVKEVELCLMEDLIGECRQELEKKEMELSQVMDDISKQKHLKSQVKELVNDLVLRQKQFESGMKDLELKEKQHEGRVKEYESKNREFEGQVIELVTDLVLKHKHFENRMKELESKEKQHEGQVEKHESKKREFKDHVTELMNDFVLKQKHFESRMKDLESKEKQYEGRVKVHESKEREFEGQVKEQESKQKLFERQVEELESKDNQLVRKMKEFESIKREFKSQTKEHFVSQMKELELKENQHEDRMKEHESKKREFEGQVKELESKKKHFDSQVKLLESNYIQLKGQTKEFFLKEREFESKMKELVVKKRRFEGRMKMLELKEKQHEGRVKEHESKAREFESKVEELECKKIHFESQVEELKSEEMQLKGQIKELEGQLKEFKSKAREFSEGRVIDLKPGTDGHTLTVKVGCCSTVTTVPCRIAECLVGDETGTIIFTARNAQVDLVKPGATLILRNAKINLFWGHMRLAVDWRGCIQLTEPASFEVRVDNNLSDDKYDESSGRCR